jgi:hypothetical protein
VSSSYLPEREREESRALLDTIEKKKNPQTMISGLFSNQFGHRPSNSLPFLAPNEALGMQ